MEKDNLFLTNSPQFFLNVISDTFQLTLLPWKTILIFLYSISFSASIGNVAI